MAQCIENPVLYYFVHLYNDFSGSPRVLREMISTVSSEKHLITSDGEGVLSDIDGVEYHLFRYIPNSNKFVKLYQFVVANIIIFHMLYRLLKANKAQEQHVIVNTMLPFGAMFAARIMKVRTTVYIHETSIKPILLKKFLRFCINKCASETIFVSNYLFETEKLENITNQYVIYNPLSNSLITPIDELDIDAKYHGRNVLFLSSLVPYKGLDDFLAIAKMAIVKSQDINFHMVLNCSVTQFNSFLKEREIPRNVTMYNRPKNLRGLYQMSSFVLNLSTPEWIETFGLTLVEGMANGAIPIGPVTGGPAEIIKSAFGYTISHDRHDEILNKIITLLNDRENFYAFSRNARDASERYFFEQYRENLQCILK
jgi:glycosyltransferase involved in cell wall biosynthesis